MPRNERVKRARRRIGAALPASNDSKCAREKKRSSPAHTALARWSVNVLLEQREGGLHAASHGGMLTCRWNTLIA